MFFMNLYDDLYVVSYYLHFSPEEIRPSISIFLGVTAFTHLATVEMYICIFLVTVCVSNQIKIMKAT